MSTPIPKFAAKAIAKLASQHASIPASAKSLSIQVVGRLRFPNLTTPDQMSGKYNTTILVPVGSNAADLTAAVDAVYAEASKAGGVWKRPKVQLAENVRNAKGEVVGYAGYDPGTLVFRASRSTKQSALEYRDLRGNAVPASDVPALYYDGRWVIALLSVFPYDAAGNRGVSLGLNRLQLLDDVGAFGSPPAMDLDDEDTAAVAAIGRAAAAPAAHDYA